MRDLPTGTVTFLFTDIEGSTRLLHELGNVYAEALAEHRRVLREVFARHGGVDDETHEIDVTKRLGQSNARFFKVRGKSAFVQFLSGAWMHR